MAKTDHRPRVARERRARMRLRILEAAMRVFGEKDADGTTIDDVIQAAGVARGTFYNHFSTTEELLVATSRWLEDDLMLTIQAALEDVGDPVDRTAIGIRLWLHWSRRDPALCRFVVRNRFRGALVEQIVTSDLRGGRRAGRLRFKKIELARDLLVGTVREAMCRMMSGPVPSSYPEDVARMILSGLHLDDRSIERLMRKPLPRLEPLT